MLVRIDEYRAQSHPKIVCVDFKGNWTRNG